MLNIHDIAEKKKVLTEYRFRLATISLFALGILILVNLILLVPLYIFSVAKFNVAEKNVAMYQQKYGNDQREKDLSAQIRDTNNKTLLLLNSNNLVQLSPAATVQDIVDIKGSSIKISGLTYDLGPDRQRIIITGIALNRDSLASFVETLKKVPTFTNVTLPISSYVKSSNISFSIILEYKGAPVVPTSSPSTP